MRQEISSSPKQPVLIPVEDVARMLSLSTRSVWRLRSAGRIPQPVTIGGSIRWKEEDLRQWIAEGCPEPG